MKLWQICKDIVLTGLGVAAILSQIFALHPSGLILGTGLALTVPSVATHVRALLPSAGDGESSESTSPRPSPPSRPSTPSQPGGGNGRG